MSVSCVLLIFWDLRCFLSFIHLNLIFSTSLFLSTNIDTCKYPSNLLNYDSRDWIHTTPFRFKTKGSSMHKNGNIHTPSLCFNLNRCMHTVPYFTPQLVWICKHMVRVSLRALIRLCTLSRHWSSHGARRCSRQHSRWQVTRGHSYQSSDYLIHQSYLSHLSATLHITPCFLSCSSCWHWLPVKTMPAVGFTAHLTSKSCSLSLEHLVSLYCFSCAVLVYCFAKTFLC